MVKQFIKDVPFGASILLFVIAIGFIAIIAPVGGNKALIVRSGSMQPAIAVGDLVTVRPQTDYKAGEIVAFHDPIKSSAIVTHRIVAKVVKNNQVFYQTKGDANEETDFSLVAGENIIGRADFSVKGIGKLLAFTKTKEGFLATVALPALLVILLEINNIIKEVRKVRTGDLVEIKKSLKHIYYHYGKPMGLSHPSASFKALLRSFRFPLVRLSSTRSILPVLISALIIGNTFSFFSDTETSINNTFTADDCFGTGNHIVINEVFYDVNPDHNGQGSENNWEWVELFNPTESTVNLTGWSLGTIGGGGTFETLPGTPSLAPCSFAIISPSTGAELEDQTNNGGRWDIPNSTFFINLSDFVGGNGLNNGGDNIVLRNNTSTEIDKMSYGVDTTGFNPAATDVASGHSLERNPDGVDTNAAGDFVDRTIPTPGT